MKIEDLLLEKQIDKKLYNEWEVSANNALEILSNSLTEKTDFEDILKSSLNLSSFNNIVKLIYLESKKPNVSIKAFDKIKRYSQGLSVDGRARSFTINEHPLSSWLEAVNIVSIWLDKNNLDAEFSSIVDYIACSTEVVNSTSNDLGLAGLVQEFLENYSFEDSFARD